MKHIEVEDTELAEIINQIVIEPKKEDTSQYFILVTSPAMKYRS